MTESKWLTVAWLGSITLGQVQAVVGIATGIAVLIYTLMRIWMLVYKQKIPNE